MRRPWESLQVAFLFYNILQTVFYKRGKIRAVTRIASTQTLFYSASAEPEQEKNRRCSIFLFFVLEIGFYHARSTDFEEKIEAL